MSVKKSLREQHYNGKKNIAGQRKSTDNKRPVWIFTNVDMAGKFAFDIHRDDFQHLEVMEKMICYSNMTWGEIKQQTHHDGKSKHHHLQYKALSKKSQERLTAKGLEEAIDALFSFALNGTLRIIGIREEERFKVLWYDPKHEVCPSHKKHT